MHHSRVLRSVSAFCAAAGILAVAGTGPYTWAFVLYAAGWALFRGSGGMSAASAFLASASAAASLSSLGTAVLLLGGFISLVHSTDRLSRAAFAASIGVIWITGTATGLLPVAIAAAAAAAIEGMRTRISVLAAGAIALLVTGGIPRPAEYPESYIQETLSEGRVSWGPPISLDLSRPVLLLKSRGTRTGTLRIGLSAGGVRDRAPLASITAGKDTIHVLAGDTAIVLTAPSMPLRLSMSRGWSPFSHPVVHLVYAEADLE